MTWDWARSAPEPYLQRYISSGIRQFEMVLTATADVFQCQCARCMA